MIQIPEYEELKKAADTILDSMAEKIAESWNSEAEEFNKKKKWWQSKRVPMTKMFVKSHCSTFETGFTKGCEFYNEDGEKSGEEVEKEARKAYNVFVDGIMEELKKEDDQYNKKKKWWQAKRRRDTRAEVAKRCYAYVGGFVKGYVYCRENMWMVHPVER